MKQLTFEFHNKKVCKDCDQEKSLDQFDKDPDGRDGFVRRCKKCRQIYMRQWYAENREKMNAYQRQWRVDNPESSIKYGRKWREKNPEYFKKLNRERWKDPAFREKQRERGRQYYIKHKEEHLERHRQWRRENPEKERATQSRRRAYDAGAEGDYTAEEFIALCGNMITAVCAAARKNLSRLITLSLSAKAAPTVLTICNLSASLAIVKNIPRSLTIALSHQHQKVDIHAAQVAVDRAALYAHTPGIGVLSRLLRVGWRIGHQQGQDGVADALKLHWKAALRQRRVTPCVTAVG